LSTIPINPDAIEPVSGTGPTTDQMAEARKETWRLLQTLVHYAHCTQAHLELADDAVSLYDFHTVEQYFKAAKRAFEPIRIAFREGRVDAELRAQP